MLKKQQLTVAVAMSGGLDSTAAAFLLQQQGFKIIGVTLDLGKFSLKNIKQAKQACQKLKIKYQVISARKLFQERIIKPFCKAYSQGTTPNPCVWCNPEIKFEFLFKKIKADSKLFKKVDYLATGHYAKIEKKNKKWALLKAKDISRDQSYFLYRLKPKYFSKILFPLGDFTKKQVKLIIQENNLKTQKDLKNYTESREICFIPDDNYPKFCRKNQKKYKLNIKPGLIVDSFGNALGKHQGLLFYTIGQRKGLGSLGLKPKYVIGIDAKKNRLIVGDQKHLNCKKMIVNQINWLVSKQKFPLKVKVKIRSQHQEASAIIKEEIIKKTKLKNNQRRKNKVLIQFSQSQRAITPGQSAVFYQGDQVIGGGIIESVLEK